MRSVPGEEKSAWSKLSQNWLKVVLKLPQSCLKIASNLCQSCFSVVLKLSQGWLKIGLKLSQSWLKVVVIVVIVVVVVVALDYNYVCIHRWKSKRVLTLSDFTASLVCLLWTGITLSRLMDKNINQVFNWSSLLFIFLIGREVIQALIWWIMGKR